MIRAARSFVNSSPLIQFAVVATLAFGGTMAVTTFRQADLVSDAQAFSAQLAKRRMGPHVVLLYVGSARCAWCKNEALPGLVAAVRDSLASRARHAGAQFSSIGIAPDVLITEGLDHLTHIGQFDQVSVGGSWLNEAMLEFVWSRYGGPGATPQLIVLSRNLGHDADENAVTLRVDDERLVARKIGLRAIDAWVRGGVPTPTLGSPTLSPVKSGY